MKISGGKSKDRRCGILKHKMPPSLISLTTVNPKWPKILPELVKALNPIQTECHFVSLCQFVHNQKFFSIVQLSCYLGRHYIQKNNTLHNDTQQNRLNCNTSIKDIKHNGTQSYIIKLILSSFIFILKGEQKIVPVRNSVHSLGLSGNNWRVQLTSLLSLFCYKSKIIYQY